MALDSYDALLGELSDWLDHDVADKAPVMVQLAEVQMRRDFPFLDGELTIDAPSDRDPSRYLDYPPGYLGMKNIRLTDIGDGYNLELVALSALHQYADSGPPASYALTGENIVFDSINANYLEITYQNQFTYLSSQNQTNWVLVTAPDAYLNLSLAYGGRWVRNAGVIQNAEKAYLAIRDSLIDENSAKTVSSGLAHEMPDLPTAMI